MLPLSRRSSLEISFWDARSNEFPIISTGTGGGVCVRVCVCVCVCVCVSSVCVVSMCRVCELNYNLI